MTTEDKIEIFLDKFKELLVHKNIKYNDSLQQQTGYFSKLSPEEKIKSRIDDKLNRIIKSHTVLENDLLDLMGYLTHLAIVMDIQDLESHYN